jgi:glycosyltransferase involved in cell wall biosynthesis
LHEKKRLIYFPNWAEDVFVQKKQIKVPEMPSGYNIMFAGNVGEAQDFETILNAAKETKQNNINWIIIGDGRKKKWVEEEIVKRNITNVYLFGRYPMEYMPSFFEKADAMLVSLKKDEIFGLTVPAKIQTYLCSGKVIIGMLDGEGAEIIKESKAGLVCNSGDTECLIKNAILLSTLSLSSIKNMEKNAIKYYNNNFDKETLLRQLEQIIISSK